MSFLLRNRNNSGGGGIIIPPASSRMLGSNTTGSHSSTTGIRSGNQMLLHRQTIQSPRARQSHQHREQKHGRESHGVISMNEVLADLKVLEQQQRDSQLKLASARQFMEQRNQQSTALDAKLGSLKYANGELRAQITQYRESLSASNRSLGSRKLIAERASADIRNFEKSLKKGLMSSRINAATLSKIDSVFILLETKANCLARIKTTLKSKLRALESDFVSLAKKDESTRNAVHQQVFRFQEGANMLATIRTESIVYERDFLTAQNMEETTRTQTKTLNAEISNASQQAEEEFNSLVIKIEDIVNNAETLDKENAALASEFEKHLEVLKELQTRQDASFDGPIAEVALDKCQKQVDTLANSNKSLCEATEQITTQLMIDSQAAANKNTEAHATAIAANEVLASEQERAKELFAFKSELEAERQSLTMLEQSSREIKETRSSAALHHEQALLLCDQEQESARVKIDQLKEVIEQGSSSYEALVSAWNITRADHLARLDGAQASYKLAESLYSSIERKSKDMEDSFEENLRKELSVIRNDMATTMRRHDATVSEVIQRHPMLQSIVSGFVHDSDIEEHSRAVLASLKEDLRNMIRKKRDTKKIEQEGHMNAELKLKRNEDGRRKNREHIEAELKRQEVALQVSEKAPATAAPNNASNHNAASTRFRKCAEFFNPASQEDYSEEETPAQPKSLLSTFAKARALPSKKSFDLTPNSRKHVHWQEEKTGGEGAIETLVEHQPKTSRKSKHYGTSKRGLAAIAGPKKPGAKKRSFDILNSGGDSHDNYTTHAKTAEILSTSELTKGKGTTAKSHTVKVSDTEPQCGMAEQKSIDAELNRRISVTSHHDMRVFLDLDASRGHHKSTDPLGSKDSQSSSRNDASPQKPSTNRNALLLAPSNQRSHSSISLEEKGNKNTVRQYRSRSSTKISSQKASSSRSEASESSRTSLLSKPRLGSLPTNKSSSRSVNAETSRNSGRCNASQGSSKRKKPIPVSSTQTSGLSSSEGLHKTRRRNKLSGAHRTSVNATDDSFAFEF